jgi:hypothetical protein
MVEERVAVACERNQAVTARKSRGGRSGRDERDDERGGSYRNPIAEATPQENPVHGSQSFRELLKAL